jgi:hypothetical protein
MKKTLVYVAGPYTKPDCVANAHSAARLFFAFRDAGLVPYVPHTDMLLHIVEPRPYEYWLQYCLDLIPSFDCVFRMPGYSEGADREVALAESLGIPVFREYKEVIRFAQERTPHA